MKEGQETRRKDAAAAGQSPEFGPGAVVVRPGRFGPVAPRRGEADSQTAGPDCPKQMTFLGRGDTRQGFVQRAENVRIY